MNKQIEEICSKCQTCLQHRPKQQKQPMIPGEIPTGPWSIVGTDMFEWNGHKFFVIVDAYSQFFEIEKLEDDTYSRTVIDRLRKIFARHGIPDKLYTDNGPQYSSHEFEKFVQEWGFQHVTSSSLYSQSNGLAESAVKTAKKVLTKCHEDQKDIYIALLNLRNTPLNRQVGSPTMRLFGGGQKPSYQQQKHY